MSLINEANSIMGHHEAADIVAQHCNKAGGIVWREFVLPDGKRADVFWCSPDGAFNVFEVKLHYSDTLARTAEAKYGRWCNSLWVAIPEMRRAHMPDVRFANLSWQTWSAPGIVGVFAAQLELLRIARHHQMHGENTAKITKLLLTTPRFGEHQPE